MTAVTIVTTDQARTALWIVTAVGALGSSLLPLTAGADDLAPLQLSIAVVSIAAFELAAFRRHWLSVAVSTVIANAAIGLEGIDDVSLTLIASGVLAFATCEATALLAVWRQLDHIAVDVEMIHVRAGLQRVGLGILGAAAVAAMALIDVPSPVVAAVVGIVAAIAVIAASVGRATSH